MLNSERIKYWLSVGAQPSDKVSVLIKKDGAEGTHVEAQRLALARLAQGRRQTAPRPAVQAAQPAAGEAPAAKAPAERGRIECGRHVRNLREARKDFADFDFDALRFRMAFRRATL